MENASSSTYIWGAWLRAAFSMAQPPLPPLDGVDFFRVTLNGGRFLAQIAQTQGSTHRRYRPNPWRLQKHP